MKNKFLIIFLCFILTLGLSACGSSSDDTSISEDSSISEDTSLFSDRDYEIGYSDNYTITLSDNNSSSDSGKVDISDNIITISEEGSYLIQGSLTNGQIVVDVDKKEKVHLILNGVTINCDSSAAIYIKESDHTYITMEKNTTNTLKVTGDYIQIDDNNIDAVIFSKSDLTLNGEGSLTVEALYGHGIVSKDDLKITGATYNITAVSSALSSNDLIAIAAGNFTINAGKDGLHSEGLLIINGGDINIEESYEGIEGVNIEINGGNIIINSSDDGINASKGKDSSISVCLTINQGNITINASGDGIDSNGDLVINGGNIIVNGPTSSGDGPIDYDGKGSIHGGTIIATGSSGMAMNFDKNSSQASILYNLSSTYKAGTKISLKDSNGDTLLETSPSKDFQSILISSEDIDESSSYTLTVGEESFSIEMNGLIYGNAFSGPGGPAGPGGSGGTDRPGGNMPGGNNAPPNFGGNEQMQ